MFKKLFSTKSNKSETAAIANLDLNRLPTHVGIIMDGNGRWAKKMGQKRTFGHSVGVQTLKNILKTCIDIHLPILTVYAFSTENWKRPQLEVNFLMKLFASFLADELESLCRDNVKINFIGRVDELPGGLPEQLHEAEELTKNNTGIILNVAVNYGGRDEIINAVKHISQDVQASKIAVDEIDEGLIDSYLYTRDLPPVDLLIRTSGDIRLSNFLLWQAAYAEFWFTQTNWPDFSAEEFIQAIVDYQQRDRRFGGLNTK